MSTARCAFYLRVSTDAQTVDVQRPDLDRLATARDFSVVATYEETASGAKARPRLDALIADARRGHFDVVCVWALDRIGRSMAGNIATVLELDRLGVRVVSVREDWLDTAGPVRSLLLAIFSWVAEQERARLVERTRAGIAAARRRGAQIGRRRRYVDVDRARALLDDGQSFRAVAKMLEVGVATLHRALERVPKTSPAADPSGPGNSTSGGAP